MWLGAFSTEKYLQLSAQSLLLSRRGKYLAASSQISPTFKADTQQKYRALSLGRGFSKWCTAGRLVSPHITSDGEESRCCRAGGACGSGCMKPDNGSATSPKVTRVWLDGGTTGKVAGSPEPAGGHECAHKVREVSSRRYVSDRVYSQELQQRSRQIHHISNNISLRT